jgi:acetyltransferase-like isoleucine patch superfamily enzyme
MMIERLMDWINAARLAGRYPKHSAGRIVCRGRLQLSLAEGALVAVNGDNFLGTALLGGTPRTATTVLNLGQKSRLTVVNATIGRGCSLVLGPNAVCAIGSGTYIADGSKIWATSSIRLGSRCAVSFGVTVLDDDGHGFGPPPYSQPVNIGNDVWIGCNVTILKGVTIGNGSVIAAGSVVNRSCPPRCLVGGVPGRIIRREVRWTDSSRSAASRTKHFELQTSGDFPAA